MDASSNQRISLSHDGTMAKAEVPTDRTASHSGFSFLETAAAIAGLLVIDLIMKFGGFPRLRRLMIRCPVRGHRKHDRSIECARGVCGSVDRACACYFRQVQCLQRSSLLACLLRFRGIPAELVIGCRKMPFHGHAWVEVDGVVVGESEKVRASYTVLDRC
jgi:hypothetical protein